MVPIGSVQVAPVIIGERTLRAFRCAARPLRLLYDRCHGRLQPARPRRVPMWLVGATGGVSVLGVSVGLLEPLDLTLTTAAFPLTMVCAGSGDTMAFWR